MGGFLRANPTRAAGGGLRQKSEKNSIPKNPRKGQVSARAYNIHGKAANAHFRRLPGFARAILSPCRYNAPGKNKAVV